MAYVRQTILQVPANVRTNGNCYQFARGAMTQARPNNIASPYTVDNFRAAITASGGIHINNQELFMEYQSNQQNYFLVAAMVHMPNEFHFMRMGLLDNGNNGWIGKWSQVGGTYTRDWNGPTANSPFNNVNAVLLQKQAGGGSYTSVGYYAYPM
jgi:hypothetical protein